MASTDSVALAQQTAASILINLYDSIGRGDLISRLVTDGIIDIGRLNEVLDSKLLNIPLESALGRDLADGTDCKFAMVSELVRKKKYKVISTGETRWYTYIDRRANINVKNVEGDIRVRLYYEKYDQWYYGVIPHNELYSKKGKQVMNIFIRFNDRGEIAQRFKKYFRKSII